MEQLKLERESRKDKIMLNSTRCIMLRAVQQHANCEFQIIISACNVLYGEIKRENSRCAEQLSEILRTNQKEFETKFREFVEAYTADFYENDVFKDACKHFYEYQRTRKALEILLQYEFINSKQTNQLKGVPLAGLFLQILKNTYFVDN